jgi:hypothetical protein
VGPVGSGPRRGAAGRCELGLDEGRRRRTGAGVGSSVELRESSPWPVARTPLVTVEEAKAEDSRVGAACRHACTPATR